MRAKRTEIITNDVVVFVSLAIVFRSQRRQRLVPAAPPVNNSARPTQSGRRAGPISMPANGAKVGRTDGRTNKQTNNGREQQPANWPTGRTVRRLLAQINSNLAPIKNGN